MKTQRIQPADRRPLVLAVAAAAVAVAVRLPNLDWGLPWLEEEAFPLKKAFAMWGWAEGRVQLDPATAGWPSFSFYLHLLLQHLHYWFGRLGGVFGDRLDFYLLQLDLTPVVVIARSVGVLAAAGVTWLGARLGWRLAGTTGAVMCGGVLAVSPLLVEQAQLITPDILLVFFAAWATMKILDILERGKLRDYLLAGIAIGLGASCKYTPGLLAPVLLLAHVMRVMQEGGAQPQGVVADRRLWLAAGACVLSFAVTSPYVVADLAVFKRDLAYQSLHLGQGHIGQDDTPTLLYYLGQVLPRALGWPGYLLAVAGLGWASWRRRGGWLLLAACVLVFTLVLGSLSTRFDRYLLPVLLPLTAGLAASGLWLRERLAERRPPWRRVMVGSLVVVVLLPAVLGTLSYHRTLALPGTLEQARTFITEELGDDLYLAMEPYCPELPRDSRDQLQADPVFASLSPSQQQRFLDRRFYNLLYLPFYISRVELGAFYYDLRLLTVYDYVVTSGAVRHRYEDQPERFPRRTTFYRDLDRYCRLVRVFPAGDVSRGPEIRIYRLDGPSRARLIAEKGELEPDFHEAHIDQLHRPHFVAFMALAGRHAEQRDTWEQADLLYSILYRETSDESERRRWVASLARTRLQTGQWESARRFNEQVLQWYPREATTMGLLGYVLEQLGDLEGARQRYHQCVAMGEQDPAQSSAARWAAEQLARLDQ